MAEKVKDLKWTALLALLQLVIMDTAEGKRTLDRCTLAREMDQLGVPRSDIAKWAIIVQKSSDYQTDAVSPENVHGHRCYGLFQISSQFWCQPSSGKKSLNICEVDCAELLTDNIEASVRCAEKVLNKDGWSPWSMHLVDFDSSGQTSIADCFEEAAIREIVNGTAAEGATGRIKSLLFPVSGSTIDTCLSKEYI